MNSNTNPIPFGRRALIWIPLLVCVMCFALTGSARADFTIPSGTEVIEEEAFMGDTSLSKVTVGEGLKRIEDRAFSGCGLREARLPASVEYIADDAFTGNEGLVISAPEWSYAEQWAVDHGFLEGSGPMPAAYFDYTILSDGTVRIDRYIGPEDAVDVTIPKYIEGKPVTEIGDYAFNYCSGLTGSLTIPDSVTSIGYGAFEYCSGFTGSLTIPDSVTSIGEWAFTECSGFTGSLTIPDSVTSIGGYAFEGCSGFTGNLTIPGSISVIDDFTFCGCANLSSVTIPDSVTHIGLNAFHGCSGLIHVQYAGGEEDWNMIDIASGNELLCIVAGFQKCEPLMLYTDTTAEITAGGEIALFSYTPVESGTYVFSSSGDYDTYGYFYDASMEQIAVNDDGGYNGNFRISCQMTAGNKYYFGARFYSSSNTGSFSVRLVFQNTSWTLENGVLTISGTGVIPDYSADDPAPWYSERDSITSLIIENGVTAIGNYAFYNCGGITGSLTIPEGVTTIGNLAFAGCNGFTGGLSLPSSLTEIGLDAFAGCGGFSGSLTIPEGVTSIGYGAFKECSGFTGNLTIPSGVTSIDEWTFFNCSGFDGTLTIPDGVTSIGNCAFSGCSGFIGSLTIPDSVTIIGGSAFEGCSGFTGSLTIPEGVTSIGDYAFEDCSGLTGSLTIPDGVTSIGNCSFSGCSGFTGSLTIPDSVTSIGSSAFANCSGFTGNLTIGNGVTIIRDAAFEHCSGFTGSLTIGNSVTMIDGWVFNDCGGFTGDLTIPASVETIGYNTFGGCIGFNGKLTIPASVTSIGTYAFSSCSNLEKVSVQVTAEDGTITTGERIAVYCPRDSYAWSWAESESDFEPVEWDGWSPAEYFEYSLLTDGTVRIDKYIGPADAENVEIPGTIDGKTVTKIGANAFKGQSGLTGALIIPDTVVSIGNYAFYHCAGFTGPLDIPDSATSIGAYSFTGCTGFDGSLTLPDGCLTIGGRAFSGCSGLMGALTIPEGLTSIGNYVFYGCKGFTGALVIPEGVTSIGNYAFKGCSGLTEVTIPASVGTIGDNAFAGCANLDTVTVKSTEISIGANAFSGCAGALMLYAEETSSVIPYAVGQNIDYAVIGWYEYSQQSDGTIRIDKYIGPEDAADISIPRRIEGKIVTSIAYKAFYGCSGLTGRLTIPDSVTSIGKWAFSGCSGFTGSLTIPDSVTSIGHRAFENCSGFTGSLTIPDSVTSIDSFAFTNCSGFTGNLTISDGVTSIQDSAFDGCSGFTGSLTIPSSVTIIGMFAFRNCSGFTGSLTIPDSVTTIGTDAFCNCSGFTGSLTIPDSVTNIGMGVFWHCSGFTGSLTIPDSVTNIGYGAFDGCSGFSGSLTIPNSVTCIDGYAFDGCSGFSGSLTIPNSVTCIDGYAFFGCSGFTGSLTIPDCVTSIGKYAFSGCSGLTGSLTIGTSVTSIGDGAFYGLSGFTGNLTIPDSVTSIGEYAFSGCSGLTGSLMIPGNVTSIGEYAFYSCSGFTGSLMIPSSVTNIGDHSFFGCSNLGKVTVQVMGYLGRPDTIECTAVYCPRDSYAWSWAEGQDWFEPVEWDGHSLPGYTSWTGYVQAARVPTYPSATSTNAGGHYVDNTDPVTVLGEEGDRYYIEYTLTAGGTLKRWVDKDLIGSNEWAPNRNASINGTVTAAGVPVEDVIIYFYHNFDSENAFASSYTDRNGHWHIDGLNIGDLIILEYSSADYTIDSQNVLLSNAVNEVNAIAYINGINDDSIVFAMTADSNLVGTTVHFSVSASGFEMVQLVVDEIAYEMYMLTDGSASIDRVFTLAGDRNIQFIGTDSDGITHKSETQLLSLSQNGTLATVSINEIDNQFVGKEFLVSWSSVEHAEKYTVYLYNEYGLVWPSSQYFTDETTVNGTSITIPAGTIIFPGTYSINVIASGYGYSQSASYPSHFSVFAIEDGVEITYPYDGAPYFLGNVMHTKLSTSSVCAGTKLLVTAPDGTTSFISHDAEGVFYPVADQLGEWVLTPYYSLNDEDFTINEADGHGESVTVNVTLGRIEQIQGTTAAAAAQFQDIDGEIYSMPNSSTRIGYEGTTDYLYGYIDHPVDAIRIYQDGQRIFEINESNANQGNPGDLILETSGFAWRTPSLSSGLYNYSFVPVNSNIEGTAYTVSIYVLSNPDQEEEDQYVQEATLLYHVPNGSITGSIAAGTKVYVGGYFGNERQYAYIGYPVSENNFEYAFIEKSALNVSYEFHPDASIEKNDARMFYQLNETVDYQVTLPSNLSMNSPKAGIKVVSGLGRTIYVTGTRIQGNRYAVRLDSTVLNQSTRYDLYAYAFNDSGDKKEFEVKDSIIVYDPSGSTVGRIMYSKCKQLVLNNPIDRTTMTVTAPDEHVIYRGNYSIDNSQFYVFSKEGVPDNIAVLDQTTVDEELTLTNTDTVVTRGIVVSCNMVSDNATTSYNVSSRNATNAVSLLRSAVPGILISSPCVDPTSIRTILEYLDLQFKEVDYNDVTYLYFSAHGEYYENKDDNGIITKSPALSWGIGFHGSMTYQQLSDYQKKHGGIAIHFIIDSCYSGSFSSYVDTAKGSMGVFATRPNDSGRMNNYDIKLTGNIYNIIGYELIVSETGAVFTINLRNYVQNHTWSTMTIQNIIDNVRSDGTVPTGNPSSEVFFRK